VEKKRKQKQKQRDEQVWTLIYTLVLQSTSSPLSFFFGMDPLVSFQNDAIDL